jgi:hypothetical protein
VQTTANLSPNASNYDSQISSAQKLLDQAKPSATKALAELDAVTSRVFREMDRFKSDADMELRKLYVAHARVQVDYSMQLDTEWRKMLPEGEQKNGGGVSKAALRRAGSSGSGKEAESLMI